MASVSLRGVYLAPVAAPSDLLRLNASVELSEVRSLPGGFRRGANGRTRLIRRAGSDRQLQVSVRRADRATRERIKDWSGLLLLLRDGRGRKVYGSYLDPKFSERPGLPVTDITLTFVELSFDEAV